VEPAGTFSAETVAQPVLRHHHLKTGKLRSAGDPITGRVPLLVNDDVSIYRCRPAESQADLYRNASADEMLFIHHGKGVLHTMFGLLL
jgi:homogentisate 1,2-dioxygenase